MRVYSLLCETLALCLNALLYYFGSCDVEDKNGNLSEDSKVLQLLILPYSLRQYY